MKSSDQNTWFETWFNTKFYHLLYKHRDDSEARDFINILFDKLKPQSDYHILDLACGRGRHARYLHQKGVTVTGLDLASASIDFAKKYEVPGLEFIVADMREPYGENRFDLILNLFTSFGYFDHYEDNLRACHQAKKALKPGGLLVIDFLNLAAVLANLVKEETIIIEGHHFRIERSVHNGQILKKIHLKEPDGTEHFFKEEVQALSIDDFKELFRQSGISLLDTFGSYKLANFDPLHSERLILLAQA